MAKTPVQLQQLDRSILSIAGSFVDLPKIDAPFTQVVNRAQVVDFSNDLMPRMGTERILFTKITEIRNERSPQYGGVYRVDNDPYDRIRLVGTWFNSDGSSNHQPSTIGGLTGATDNFIEIVFYGTGLNLLASLTGSGYDYRYTVDGGAESGNFTLGTYSPTVTVSRGSPPHTLVNVVDGLTLGLHTVKIRFADGGTNQITGVEIVNTNSNNIVIPPGTAYVGGKKISSISTTITPYNSSFESGALGTRGGHVLVYLKDDGTVAKAVTPTESSSLFLTAANHANEEIYEQFHFRQFGAGFLTNEPSNLNSAIALDVAAQLDSNAQVSLTGDDATSRHPYANAPEGMGIPAPGDQIFLSWVGTGLDIEFVLNTPTGSEGCECYIDGVDVGDIIPTSNTYGNTVITLKAASGLPYGTHTLLLNRLGTATDRITVRRFITYRPKKPVISSEYVELGQYCVIADFSQRATRGRNFVSTGVLRQHALKNIAYVGTWITPTIDPVSHSTGWNVLTTTNGSYVEYWFWGTGVEYCWYAEASANNRTILIDGSGNVTGFTTNVNAPGLTYNTTTGAVTGSASDSGKVNTITIRGLTLGMHRIRVTRDVGAGTNTYFDSFDVIAPIHMATPGYGFSGTDFSSIPHSIVDIRPLLPEVTSFTPSVLVNGRASSPSTTTTQHVPLQDMIANIVTKGNPIKVSFQMPVKTSSAGSNIGWIVKVDGIIIRQYEAIMPDNITEEPIISADVVVPVEAGPHNVQIFWSTSVGTITGRSAYRTLTVTEL